VRGWRWCGRALAESWSVRELEQQLRKLKAETTVKSPGRRRWMRRRGDPRFGKRLAAKLNTRVSLKHAGKRGRIVIEYFGDDDLQRILDRLGVGT